MRRQGKWTVGSKLGEEKLTNPFLRVKDPYYEALTGEKDVLRRF